MIYPWQNAQWQQLQQAAQRGRLHHALLLYGQNATGKSDFAVSLAHSLLCKRPDAEGHACGECETCQLIAAGTHPDLTRIEPLPPKDSKSADPVLSIRIEAIRQLSDKLATTAQLGGRRVVIIEGADRMGHNAANSLLKTLEEPGDDTHLLLVTSQPHRLPITIRSRCQQIAFPPPATQVALDWLQQQGVRDAADTLARHHGSPLSVIREDDASECEQTLASALLARSNKQASLQYSGALAKLPRARLLAGFMDWLADLARLKSGLATRCIGPTHSKQLSVMAEQADWKRLYRLQDEVTRLSRYDSIALNNQLFWENLLISWDRL